MSLWGRTLTGVHRCYNDGSRVFADVGVFVLRSSALDSVCVWSADPRMSVDVGLDAVSGRSYGSGTANTQKLANR